MFIGVALVGAYVVAMTLFMAVLVYASARAILLEPRDPARQLGSHR
jgi:hypothetical protein